MKYTNRLINLGQQLADKYAQTVSAQPGDVENALRSAGLWDKTQDVSPMLNAAGVPDDASVVISMQVDPALNFTYPVVLTPPNKPAAFKLASAIKMKFGPLHKAAAQKAGLKVANPLVLQWMKF